MRFFTVTATAQKRLYNGELRVENGELRVKTFGFLRLIETAAASHRPTLMGGSICKEPRRPIYFLPFLWYNLTNR